MNFVHKYIPPKSSRSGLAVGDAEETPFASGVQPANGARSANRTYSASGTQPSNGVRPTAENGTSSSSIGPTLVLLHGTGGDESDLLPIGRLLAPRAGLLGVRGQVLEGTSRRFFRRLAEGVFDEQDLIFRTHELARFLEEASAVYGLDKTRLIAVGYSNGANIAASTLLLESNIFSAAVLFRAMVPLQPAFYPSLTGKEVLMMCGRRDTIVPQENSETLADMLRQAGAHVDLRWHNAGHGILNAELEYARGWLTSVLEHRATG